MQKGIKSLAELENRSNLAPRTVYKWDAQRPSVDKAAAVAKTLGVTVDELLKEETPQRTGNGQSETA